MPTSPVDYGGTKTGGEGHAGADRPNKPFSRIKDPIIMKTLATLVPLACLVAVAAAEDPVVPTDRPADGTRRPDLSALATPLGFTCELQGIYLTRSIEMLEDETDTKSSGTNVTGRTEVSKTKTDTKEDGKSEKDVVFGDRRKRNSWQVSAEGGAGLKWGKWGLVPNASVSLGGNVSWADDSEKRESREQEDISKRVGSDTTLLSGEVIQSVEKGGEHQEKVVTRRGDYKLVLSVRLRNTDTTDTLVVDLSQATAKIKGPGLTGVLPVPCCEKKTIELSAQPTDCKFELIIEEERQRNELLRLRAEGALSLLRLDVSGADFPVVSGKTGKNVLAEQANREQRRPGTHIAVEIDELQDLSPWRVSRRHTAESGTRGTPVTLREALLAVEGAVYKQSDSLPETVFSFSKDGTLRKIINRLLLEKSGSEDYRMFAVRLTKEKNGATETEVRLPLAPTMERRIDACSEIALIEFSFSEFARAAILSPDYFAPLRKEIEDYLAATDEAALAVWKKRFADAQREDDDSPLPEDRETITALDVERYHQRAEAGVPNMQYKLALCLFYGWGQAENKEKAVEWYHEAAEQGLAAAQVYLGYCYGNGKGVGKDFRKSLEWYRKAAEQGSADAQFMLGWYYSKAATQKNTFEWYREAAEWYRKAAEQGHMVAQKYLGYCYEDGEGVPKDMKEAVNWFSKAAEQGDADAQFWLGGCYAKGEDVPKNMQKAVEWLNKSAEQGDAAAQHSLGLCYENGAGVPKDMTRAAQWYRKAAEQGVAMAQNNLGWCYDNGEGVPKDKKKAVEWYRKAAEQGDAAAQNNLGCCYENGEGVPIDMKKAVEWYRKAADQGLAAGQYHLGVCHEYGEGMPIDMKKAVEWYSKAAEQGDADAQFSLGWCYDNGEGVPKDIKKAIEWYSKAAEQGHMVAQNNLGYCYENGEGVPKDKKKAVEWYRKAAEQGVEEAKKALKRLER